jgi:anion-transporting  ArsA/GET3 family ATPase
MKDLAEHGIEVHHLIINNVIEGADCDFLEQRRAMQQPYIASLEEDYGDAVNLTKLPLLPYEVKGIERLKEVERWLFRDEQPPS